MGIFSAFRFASKVATSGAVTSAPTSGHMAPVSPWTASTVAKVAWADILGLEAEVVTRQDAMKVPAVAKGRALITGTLSRQPLATFRGTDKVESPAWLYRTNTDVSPRQRMLWTFDDLIFNGASLWAVERGASGQITDAVRVPPEWWEFDRDLRVLVNGQPVGADEVILIQGPQEGLLEIACSTIRAALAMERAWSSRVSTPAPLVELHNTDAQMPLTETEVGDLVAAWEGARQSGGATAYTPAGIEAKIHGQTDANLFIEGRNALRLDIANFLNLPGALLDGSTATASLTYSTKETSRNELVDLSLAYWATAVEARLSQDDVTPRGTRIAFDIEYLSAPNQPAQSPALED